MASVYATIANGGVRVEPSIVAGTTNGSGTFTPAPAPRRTRVLQPRTARELMAILQQWPALYAPGGQPRGADPGYSITAKTGTTQVPDPQRRGSLNYDRQDDICIAASSNPPNR